MDDQELAERIAETIREARVRLLERIAELPEHELPHGPARDRLVMIALGAVEGWWADVCELPRSPGGPYWVVRVKRPGEHSGREMSPQEWRKSVEGEEGRIETSTIHGDREAVGRGMAASRGDGGAGGRVRRGRNHRPAKRPAISSRRA